MAIPEIDASIERIIEGKRQAGRYFFRWELPKTGPQFDLFESLDRTTLDIAAEVFWHSGFSHSGFLSLRLPALPPRLPARRQSRCLPGQARQRCVDMSCRWQQ